MTSDVRTLFARKIRSYGTTALMTLLYPRILAIHDLAANVGFPAGPNGRLKMPALMRAGYGWMVAEGAYLMSELASTSTCFSLLGDESVGNGSGRAALTR